MPSSSEKQHNLMVGVCNNKEFSKKVGIDQKVGCDFEKADNGKTFKEGENPTDIIAMDVPLFIRILEFAREDASSDVDLHDLAEKAIELSKNNSLTMDNYESLIAGLQTKEPTVESIKESIIQSSKKIL